MYEPRTLGLPAFRMASMTGAAGISGYGFGGVTSVVITIAVLALLFMLVVLARFVARRTVGRHTGAALLRSAPILARPPDSLPSRPGR